MRGSEGGPTDTADHWRAATRISLTTLTTRKLLAKTMPATAVGLYKSSVEQNLAIIEQCGSMLLTA